MLRYAPDNQPGNTGYRPADPIVPGVTYGGSPGAWANGMYGGGHRGYNGGGFMGNYISPRLSQPPPQDQQDTFNQSPFQDSGIGDFLRRLRGFGQFQQFQPVNLFQPAAGINLQGAFGGGT